MKRKRRRATFCSQSYLFEKYIQVGLFTSILIVAWIKFYTHRIRSMRHDSATLSDPSEKSIRSLSGGVRSSRHLTMPRPFSETVNVVVHNSAASFRWKKTMGFTGESLQYENIMEALKILNVTVHNVDYEHATSTAL